MSIFHCIDMLNDELESIEKKSSKGAPWYYLRTYKDKFSNDISEEITLILKLKTQLKSLENETEIEHLIEELTPIYDDLIQQENPKKKYIIFIKNDIKNIIDSGNESLDKLTNPQKVKIKMGYYFKPDVLEVYNKFQSEPYRIAKIDQGQDPSLGLSQGECYGFTFAMVDPELSPYKKSEKTIKFVRPIHDYQRDQNDRKRDQGAVKKTRLTREYFCPNLHEQAEKIIIIAEKNLGKELGVVRRCSRGGHVTYLCAQHDGKVRYMDPNHGAYLFNNKEEFIEFYNAAAEMDKTKGLYFKFYEIDHLQDDKENHMEESMSWRGKIRSLLTGTKYNDNHDIANASIFVAYGTLGCGIGASIGAIVGSIVPVIGTILGAIVGGTIGLVAGSILEATAEIKGNFGLLGVPHYVQERWHSLTENISELMRDFTNKNPTAELNHPSPSPRSKLSTSTATILSSTKDKKYQTETSIEDRVSNSHTFIGLTTSTVSHESSNEPPIEEDTKHQHPNTR